MSGRIPFVLYPSRLILSLFIILTLTLPLLCEPVPVEVDREIDSQEVVPSPRKPNIILIIVDDLGWMDLACYGSGFYETPHIDRLALKGMRFTNAYAAASVCSPTRAAILTGRYPARLGITDWIHHLDREAHTAIGTGKNPEKYVGDEKKKLLCPPNPYWMDLEEITIAEILKSASYVTCHVGKWHLGHHDWYPDKQGFDINIGGCEIGQPPTYFDPYYQNPRRSSIPTLAPRKQGEYLTDREGDEAVQFIRENRNQPFFLHLCHYAVHTPLEAKRELVNKYKAKEKTLQNNPIYAAMIESVDWVLGRIMDTLEELNLNDRTLVIFTSDNGGLLGHSTDNTPLRSGKGYPYEGGIRVPLIIRWPGVVEAGTTCQTPVSSIDFFPTICEAVDVKLPKERVIDGVSLVPLLKQYGLLKQSEKIEREALYWHFPHYRGSDIVPYSIVRRGDWKLIKRYEGKTFELFNLKDDLEECHDLSTQMPEKVRELNFVLSDWLMNTGAELPRTNFLSSYPEELQRAWVGPEFWANRLQDWRIIGGRLECVQGSFAKPMRTVHLLTRRMSEGKGAFQMSVLTGVVGKQGVFGRDTHLPKNSTAGFLIGAGAELDYRAAALVHHSAGPGGGILAGMNGAGRAVFRDGTVESFPVLIQSQNGPESVPSEARIVLTGKPEGKMYNLELEVIDEGTDTVVSRVALDNVGSDRLIGSVALVSHPGFVQIKGDERSEKGENKKETSGGRGGKSHVELIEEIHGARFWFRDWRVSGPRIEVNEDRTCGPILSTQYTLSHGVMKMTAQMMPLGESDTQTVRLEISQDGSWKEAATAEIITPGWTAPFRVENWEASKDTPYRVVYDLKQADGSLKTYTYSCTVRREPLDKNEIVVAAFTGNHNVKPGGVDRGFFEWTHHGCWFPHNELVEYVFKHDPDVLFFSGDQVYEGASPTRAEIDPLDYLYKWYLWCWAFKDLTRDRPSISIPDDHDVYQGNIWGAGGRKAERQDDGGYTRPVFFVKMVERTQTSHLPDPYDPTPIEQGIGVYYCAMNYGRISFAVIEDRKFKSSPTVMVPEGKVVNGWFQNLDFDPAKNADVEEAVLLGQRQLDFLHEWSKDWSRDARIKVVLSQTLFSNVATLLEGATSGSVIPSLEYLLPDEYPEGWHLAADADSNGWPQSGRNRALREMRRGFALHICGDQHLGSTIQYGVDEWHDAGFALCVPSVANFWPRRWYPPEPGSNRDPDADRYTGDYHDGFGNLMTVFAVSNPVITGRKPAILYDRAPGYGIVRLNTETRDITIECWPRWEDPSKPSARQYPGWPIIITQAHNYGRKPVAYLPTIEVTGMDNPVIQVIEESTGEVVYTLRIRGNSFYPKVFAQGKYSIKVGNPDTDQIKLIEGVHSLPEQQKQILEVKFE